VIPLKSEYVKDGILRRVLLRQEDVCIAGAFLSRASDATPYNYEVWMVQTGADRVIGGQTVLASEFPPSSSEWGRKGWTFDTLEKAQAKASELLAKGAK
jgi:hypothetical protein